MDFTQALIFQFKDAGWTRKFLIMALLSLIPIFGQVIVLGWSLGITRRVIQGESELLPEIDLSNDLLRGLKAWGIDLIYLLPAAILAAPIGIGIAIMLAGNDGGSATFWVLTGLCLLAALIFYGIAFIFVLPAVYGNFLSKGEWFQAGLQVREIADLVRRNPTAYFLAMVGGFLCVLITLLGLVGCVIGVVATGLYTQTVIAHLYGQAYRSTRGILPPGR